MNTLDESKEIFHTVKFEYLKKHLEEGCMYFSKLEDFRTRKKDPLESFCDYVSLAIPGFSKPVDAPQYAQDSYISSWRLEYNDEYMWNNFSIDGTSIQISTTVGKLKKIMENFVLTQYKNLKRNEVWQCSDIVSLEPIDYYLDDYLHQVKNQLKQEKEIGRDTLTAMLNNIFKLRKLFSNEKELRAYIHSEHDYSFLLVPVDFMNFIDSISFDPKATDSFKEEAATFLTSYGFCKKIIKTAETEN